MPVLISIIIMASILLGGSTVFYLRLSAIAQKLLLAFSGAYLLSITFTSIFPELFGPNTVPLQTSLFVLGGFMLQLLLEFFSHGIEHGHTHTHHAGHTHSGTYILSLSAGLYIHSFLEGFPLWLVDRIDHPLLWGIVLHNIPISIAYSWMLKSMHVKTPALLTYLFVFSIITPAGLWAGQYISTFTGAARFGQLALALAAGIFLHISTTILFETGENHRYNYRKLLVILAGVLAAAAPHLVE